jgi:hypothetical protein
VLDGAIAALRDTGELIQKREGGVSHISARIAGTEKTVVSEEWSTALDHSAGVISDAMRRISEIYQRDQSRKPRVIELMELMTFVLGYRADLYVSDAQEVKQVTVE